MIERQWGERLIRAWSEGWMELPTTIGDRLGAELLGAAPGQTAIADSTTVCFYKLAERRARRAPGAHARSSPTATTSRPTATCSRASPTSAACDDPVDRGRPRTGPSPTHVEPLVNDNTALVTFSQVNYRSAFILDTRRITEIAHDDGALALWDLCHSAGAIPVTLDDDGVDLAVGCTYKYLNAGPGAPAFLYVATEHQDELRQPIWGWLGRAEPFEMAQGYIPAHGISAMLSGTPPVLGADRRGGRHRPRRSRRGSTRSAPSRSRSPSTRSR